MEGWRPDNWDNPHIDKWAKSQGYPNSPWEESYEAGADALLKGVIEFLRSEQNNYNHTYYGACCRKIADKLEQKKP